MRAPRLSTRLLAGALSVLAFALGAAPTAHAHGLAGGAATTTRFALPPWVVWITGAAVVAVSFLLVAAFVRRRDDAPDAKPHEAAQLPPRRALEAVGLVVMALVAVVAFLPARESLLPHAALWLVLWGLLPLLAYTLGDPWARANPFQALGRLVAPRRAAPLHYPAWLGAWPAVVLLLAVTGLEVWGRGEIASATLARLLLAYAAFTLVGVALFGADAWLARAEVFTRTYRTLAAAAPLARDAQGRWRLRAPWQRLREHRTREPGAVAFVVALLYGVNFDSFLSTPPGRAALARLDASVGEAGGHLVLLVGGFLVFLALFGWTAAAIRRKAEAVEPAREMAALFAVSLLPIAIAYHAAHYLVFLVQAAPLMAHALVDPLGLGWVGGIPTTLAMPAWMPQAESLLQLVLILGGHVVAVAAAHELAQDGFESRIQAFRSELPLTRVMVFYTLVGLWIVSQAAHAGVAP